MNSRILGLRIKRLLPRFSAASLLLASFALSAAPNSIVFPVFDVDSSRYQTTPGLGPERFTPINNLFSSPKKILGGFGNMYNGHVLQEADPAYPYKMWFFGWAASDCNRGVKANNGCDAIFYARSKDLGAWEVYAGQDWLGKPKFDSKQNVRSWVPVLTASGQRTYDQWHNGDPSVVRLGDTYIMAYSATGFDRDGIPDGTRGDTDKDQSVVAGAYSKDGIRWTRLPQPLLISPADIGSNEPVQNSILHRPSLMVDEGRFKIWFDYWDNANGLSMGMAELPGPATLENFISGRWVVRQGDTKPAIANWPNPSVVKVGGRYFSYADPVGYGEGWPGRKVAEAVSDDGWNWKVTGYLEPAPGCSASQVPEASVVNGKIVIITACQMSGSQEPYDFRYKAMHLLLRSIP